MSDDPYRVQWAERQAVMELPEHIDVSNAGQIREELLSVINRGAAALIADMTATISCDHAGAEAVARAHLRAAISGTDFRLVVPAQVVRRVLSMTGVDRLVSIYPSLEAATAARPPDAPVTGTAAAGMAGHTPPSRGQASKPRRAAEALVQNKATAVSPVAHKSLRRLRDGSVKALQDGMALADSGGTITLANTRLEEDVAGMAAAAVAAEEAGSTCSTPSSPASSTSA